METTEHERRRRLLNELFEGHPHHAQRIRGGPDNTSREALHEREAIR